MKLARRRRLVFIAMTSTLPPLTSLQHDKLGINGVSPRARTRLTSSRAGDERPPEHARRGPAGARLGGAPRSVLRPSPRAPRARRARAPGGALPARRRRRRASNRVRRARGRRRRLVPGPVRDGASGRRKHAIRRARLAVRFGGGAAGRGRPREGRGGRPHLRARIVAARRRGGGALGQLAGLRAEAEEQTVSNWSGTQRGLREVRSAEIRGRPRQGGRVGAHPPEAPPVGSRSRRAHV